ncbi:hypothetical protein [Prevotella sp. OH937_COT-195]|uniref:hypothetical protein n=1 Tax=Prevotella sp. OH937_COT-195 TaxID=2491051 RepID=UPI000F649F4D|nr:hypothetical protein [Prevotella sp. OH937_COT-195]RRD02311.1 hypothetical protein EII32_03590 [Prevotella sp. OH937_COT-195]
MKRQKPTQGVLRRLLALYNGEELTQSETQTRLFYKMKLAGVLIPATQHGTRTTFKVVSLERMKEYLLEEFSIQDLQSFHKMQFAVDADNSGIDKQGAIVEARNTKTSYMEGFFVTSVEPIDAHVGGAHLTINPPRGTYMYIYEYKVFCVPHDVLIVGVESADTFHRIHSFLNILPNKKTLFVHRYPQRAELTNWLKTIGNQYIHFADFDLVSIYNFQSDIFSRIGERATFFIPQNINELIERGSRKRYDVQIENYRNQPISDMRLKPLVELINARHRCYMLSDYFD